MKVANNFDQVKDQKLPPEITSNDYLNAFANKMMLLSNDFNDEDSEVLDLKDDYLPAIREFITNINGL